jgi:hypothetical protein
MHGFTADVLKEWWDVDDRNFNFANPVSYRSSLMHIVL